MLCRTLRDVLTWCIDGIPDFEDKNFGLGGSRIVGCSKFDFGSLDGMDEMRTYFPSIRQRNKMIDIEITSCCPSCFIIWT